jgi:hypothetical protein
LPTPSKRWTVLIVSHDSDAPRSIAVSQRALRLVVSLGVFAGLILLIGVGSAVARLGRIDAFTSRSAPTAGAPQESSELRALRERASSLRDSLNEIQEQEGQLRRIAGIPAADTTTLLHRLLPRLPALLRPRGAHEQVSAGRVVQMIPPPEGTAAPSEASRGAATADSLLAHAGDVAHRFRSLTGSPALRRDSIDVQSLHPDSLRNMLDMSPWRGQRRGTRLEFTVERAMAISAPFAGWISDLRQTTPGFWALEMRDQLGGETRLVATGRPLVRSGERVSGDQLVFVVEAGAPGAPSRVLVERRTAGIAVNPAAARTRWPPRSPDASPPSRTPR